MSYTSEKLSHFSLMLSDGQLFYFRFIMEVIVGGVLLDYIKRSFHYFVHRGSNIRNIFQCTVLNKVVSVGGNV